MRRYLPFLALLLVWVAVSLACTRSASQGMPPTPTYALLEEMFLATPTVAATEIPGPLPLRTPPGVPTPTLVIVLPPSPTPGPDQPTPTSASPTPVPTPQSQPTPTPVVTERRVPERYTLHEGEFPYCLARRFNINPDDLLTANGLVRGQQVYPGMTLVIPENARPWPPDIPRSLLPHPTTYTVMAGDTVYSVACKFGDVWPEDIARANGIPLDQMGEPLTPGTVLNIP